MCEGHRRGWAASCLASSEHVGKGEGKISKQGTSKHTGTQTHRHTDTDTHTHTDTHRHRHTDTQTQTHTHTDTHRYTQTHTHRHRHTHTHTDTGTHTHTHIQTQTHTHTHTHTGCDHGVASILWLDVEVTGHNEREFLCSGATPVHQLLRVHGHHVGLSKLAWHVVCCHRKRLFCQRGKFGLGCRPEGKVSNRSAGGKQGAGAKHKE